MVNTIINTISFLVALGTKAVAALAQHAATLNLPHTEDADLPTKITAVTTTNTAHKEALLEMKNRQAAVKLAVGNHTIYVQAGDGGRFEIVYRPGTTCKLVQGVGDKSGQVANDSGPLHRISGVLNLFGAAAGRVEVDSCKAVDLQIKETLAFDLHWAV